MAQADARYAFLHEGVLRGYLSKIGQRAGDAAIYWKYGCWSYEETTDSRVLIEGPLGRRRERGRRGQHPASGMGRER